MDEAAGAAATSTAAREQTMATASAGLAELRAARPGFVFGHSEKCYWGTGPGGRKYNALTPAEMLARIDVDSGDGPS